MKILIALILLIGLAIIFPPAWIMYIFVLIGLALTEPINFKK